MVESEDGSIAPLIAVILALCGAMIAVLGNVGERLVAEDRARITAEASALAGIYGGVETAIVVARRNGGELIDAQSEEGHFSVTVSFGANRASAHAVDTWLPTSPTLKP